MSDRVSVEDLLTVEVSRLNQLLANARGEKAEVDIRLAQLNYRNLIISLSTKYGLTEGDSFKPDTGEIVRMPRETVEQEYTPPVLQEVK